MILNKTAILEASDLKTETVTVPEWGGDVIVRSITALDRYALIDFAMGADGTIVRDKFVIGLLAASLVGEDGNRLFTNDEIQLLAGKSFTAIDRLIEVANRINGFGVEQEAIAKN